jgi:ATP-binding protein involved in chromosome partitioning
MSAAETKWSTIAADHAQNPRHWGPLAHHNGYARITGPCGDTMQFWLIVGKDRIVDASFATDGCGSSLASGSMTATLAIGKTLTEATGIDQRAVLAALGGLPQEEEHCSLLAANTLAAACANYRENYPERVDENIASSCDTCEKEDGSAVKQKNGESDGEFADRQQLESRLCRIKCKIIVLSGKGGVGKSTVAVNLAAALQQAGKTVGLLDADIHGPSIPTMLGLERVNIFVHENEIFPAETAGLKVMSLGFFLRNADEAVIWRGPMKQGAIKQFLKDVVWGDLDYLIIDLPPGTGDEPLSVCQLIDSLDGAVVVTTPQKVAAVDVRKSITFCRQLNVPVIGVVENMSGFVCPHCGTVTEILSSGGGQRLAEDMKVPFLGTLPMDPQIAQAGDDGQAFIAHKGGSATALIMKKIIKPLLTLTQTSSSKIEGE